MRFSRIRARGVVVVSAAVMALHGMPVLAQFVPFGGTPDQNQDQGYVAQTQHYAQPQQSYAHLNQGYHPYAAHTAPQAQSQFSPFAAQQYQPQYVAMAMQNGAPAASTPTLSQPSEQIAPGTMQPSIQPAPAASEPMYSAAPAYSAGPVAEPVYSGTGYTQSSCGSSYNTFDNFCGTNGSCEGYGASSCATGYNTCAPRGGRRWFGGFYGLYLERKGNPWRPLAFSTPNTNAPPYYPADGEFVVNLTDIDNDTFAGAEVRFGATFGGGGGYGRFGRGCDSCGGCGGCGCSCGPRHAWEVAYWGLLEDESTFVATDLATDANRLYGMIDYRGLEYNPGTGYRPVNHYYDYGPPTSDYTGGGALDEIQIRSITARNSFSLQNLEVNLLHLPLCGGGYYAAGAGVGRRGLGLGRRAACGGYGSGCDSCAGGSCGTGSCGVGGGCCAGPGYSITGVVGFRYIRIDEDFMFRTDFENVTTPGTGFLSNNIDVDSHLAGAHFGCNAIWRCGCSGRWALHCNTNVGIFNNHAEVWNRMDSPTGDLRFISGTNADFDLRYEDDNIAVLGELRAGASYQYSCNWRFFGGYRLFGLTGAALAFDQIPDAFSTPAQVSYVDSDGSIFLHGLQGGIECTY